MNPKDGEILRIHYLQHVPLETPGSILDWAREHGHQVTHTLFHEGGTLPELDRFDWLVIMGGPMNVYEEDRHPWLVEEKQFIGRAIAAGKVVLGFCLGGQLIADVIGGKVTANGRPEIGWLEIRWEAGARANPLFSFFPERCMVFQWHNDTFSVLPPEATLLATSDICAHQAFVYRERVFGFQFHLENTAEMIQELSAESAGEEERACGQPAVDIVPHPQRVEENNRWMSELLTRLEARERARAPEV